MITTKFDFDKELDMVVSEIRRDAEEGIKEDLNKKDYTAEYYGYQNVRDLVAEEMGMAEYEEIAEELKKLYEGVEIVKIKNNLEDKIERAEQILVDEGRMTFGNDKDKLEKTIEILERMNEKTW